MKVKDHSARLKKGPRRALPIRPPWCALHAYPLLKITGRCKQVTSLLDCFVTYLYQLKKTCEERDTCLAFLFHYQSVYSTEAPGTWFNVIHCIKPLKCSKCSLHFKFHLGGGENMRRCPAQTLPEHVWPRKWSPFLLKSGDPQSLKHNNTMAKWIK